MKEEKDVTQELPEDTPEETETQADQTANEEVLEPSREEELQQALSEKEDQFLRAQAEISNMRNRFKKEREGLLRYRSQDLGKALLPALDNLERALATEVSQEQATSLKKGIEMVLESLQHALNEEGITEIEAMGVTFDPNIHQAVQTIPAADGVAPDEIVAVLQKGYRLHERVLRPSMVVVAQ